jgi:uncharacterized membrane protein HdeD (DUF308 family)
MRHFEIVLERHPMLWVLVGLLFNATGLYLGFEYSLSFAYMVVGWFCSVYGVALLFFRLSDRSNIPESARLSPNFISYGSTVVMPKEKVVDQTEAAETSDG